MVPKSKYIQRPCEKLAKNGMLKIDDVTDLFNKYWKIAIITKEEDKLISSKSMPDDWDNVCIYARYNKAGITLKESVTNFV